MLAAIVFFEEKTDVKFTLNTSFLYKNYNKIFFTPKFADDPYNNHVFFYNMGATTDMTPLPLHDLLRI